MPVPMVSPYLIAGGGALGLLNYLEQKKNYGAQLRAAQEAREREAEIQKFSPWTKRQGQVINNPGAPSLWGNVLQGAGTGVALAPLTDMMIKDPNDAKAAQEQEVEVETEPDTPGPRVFYQNPYDPITVSDDVYGNDTDRDEIDEPTVRGRQRKYKTDLSRESPWTYSHEADVRRRGGK